MSSATIDGPSVGPGQANQAAAGAVAGVGAVTGDAVFDAQPAAATSADAARRRRDGKLEMGGGDKVIPWRLGAWSDATGKHASSRASARQTPAREAGRTGLLAAVAAAP